MTISQPINIPIPAPVSPSITLTESDRDALTNRIKTRLRERDAVLVAHYYTPADMQRLAEETGGHVSDSLDMARFGNSHPASTLIVAGVRFMGETAKILNPEKTVLMPTLEATCSLDLGCPSEAFTAFCDAHPDRTVVVYANTSAAVKARADWVVTSAIAIDIVDHLMSRGEKIIWAPDKHLGAYIQRETGADMLLWNSACIVHDEFKARELTTLKKLHPNAAVLAHPESPAAVLALADIVGSTTRLIQAAAALPNETLIVATDKGIFYKMQQAAPGKRLIEAPTGGHGATCQSCAHCPWMAMNDLQRLAACLDSSSTLHEIHIEEATRVKALIPLTRMLEFAKSRKAKVYGKSRG